MAKAAHGRGLVDVAWVKKHPWKLIVGGERVEAASGRRFEKVSPIDRSVACTVPDADAADVDRAVAAAQRAQPAWAAVPVRERARLVRALAARLREHREELAALDAVDVGNAYTPMLQDVEWGADGMEFMAENAFELRGETLPANSTHFHYTKRVPYGVVARIVAFNHPIMFAAQKIAAPLVAGNAVILKPSDLSPLSALFMGELFADMLPKGLLSVLTGKGIEMPRALVRHPGVRRIGFIGSEPVGRTIQADAAAVAVKDVTLELGGKNAMLVCPDVDIGAAAAGVVKGMNFIGWQSQSCSSTSRLLVHEDIADALVEAVVALVDRIRIGNPLDPDTQMGTLANAAQYDKTLRYIGIAASEGAVQRTGGALTDGPFGAGYFVAPTVFDKVTPQMRIANEEVFGPVLSTIRWKDEDEAMRIANAVTYGLTGAIWTRDIDRAHRLADRMDAGYIWINDTAAHFTGVPFGGVKASGLGREESIEELQSYTTVKTFNQRLG